MNSMTIKIGMSVNPKYAPMAASLIANALAYNIRDENQDSAIEYFIDGIEYISEGLGVGVHTVEEHEAKINALVTAYFERYDGLVLPGNALNINEKFYSDNEGDIKSIGLDKNESNNRRTKLEIALVQGAVERGIPVLGICGGHQVINVALGGKLKTIGDINAPFNDTKEEVIYLKDTQLHGILKENLNKKDEDTNFIFKETSMHHQAIDPNTLPNVLLRTAEDKKGVIKGVEMKGHHPWLMGVQFHPEYDFKSSQLGGTQNIALFKDFLTACRVVEDQKKKKEMVIESIKEHVTVNKNVNSKESQFHILLEGFKQALEIKRYDEINILALKNATKTIPALIQVLQAIDPKDRLKFVRACGDMINQTDISQVVKLSEYLPPGDKRSFFSTKIQDENTLLKAMKYLSKSDSYLLIDALKDSLRISFDKMLKLLAPTNKKSENNDCFRLCHIFKSLTEDLCREFISKYHAEISNKIQDADDVASVLQVLAAKDRVDFASMHLDKITNGEELSVVVDVLDSQDKLTFALTQLSLISNGQELSGVAETLEEKDKLGFVLKCADKINDANGLRSVLLGLGAYKDEMKDVIDRVITKESQLFNLIEGMLKKDRFVYAVNFLHKIESDAVFSRLVKLMPSRDLQEQLIQQRDVMKRGHAKSNGNYSPKLFTHPVQLDSHSTVAIETPKTRVDEDKSKTTTFGTSK